MRIRQNLTNPLIVMTAIALTGFALGAANAAPKTAHHTAKPSHHAVAAHHPAGPVAVHKVADKNPMHSILAAQSAYWRAHGQGSPAPK